MCPYIFSSIIIIIIICFSTVLTIYFFTQGYNNSTDETPKIPLDIYQTWHTKDLPTKMEACINHLKRENPEFEHHLYDDNDCINFIKSNYDREVVDAFEKLLPGAYKADLFRYCILYKKGGVYLDIKYKCEPGFKLITLTDKEHFVLERPCLSTNPVYNESVEDNIINSNNFIDNFSKYIDPAIWEDKKIGIYNALMICKANNPVLLGCIHKIVENVKNRNYGYSPIYVTGPGILGYEYFKGDYSKMTEFDLFFSSQCYIRNKTGKILSFYDEYRDEQKKYGLNTDYWQKWLHKKDIFLSE